MAFLIILNMMTEWDFLKKIMIKNLFMENLHFVVVVATEEEEEGFIGLQGVPEEEILIIGEGFKIIEVPEDHMGKQTTLDHFKMFQFS